jgi:hypothetical protein
MGKYELLKNDGCGLIHRYNAGRDEVVGNVTGTMIPLQSVTNQSTFSGQSSFGNYTYQTDVTYVSGLLNDTSGTSSSFPKDSS